MNGRSQHLVKLEYHCTRVQSTLEPLRGAVVAAFGEVFMLYSRELELALLAPSEAVDDCIGKMEGQLK